MKIRSTSLTLLLAAAAALAPLRAGAGPYGSYLPDGRPLHWDNTLGHIFAVSAGPLGNMSHAQADQMVATAFKAWTSLDGVSLMFDEDPAGVTDTKNNPLVVTGTNASIQAFLTYDASGASDIPVVLDNDGSFTEAALGNGAAQVELAFPLLLQGDVAPDTGTIAHADLVINGRAMDGQFDPDDVTLPDLTRATIRAIGEVFNLGLTDLNGELLFDGNKMDLAALPIMSASAVVNNDPIRVLGGGSTPTLDDRMTMGSLYPATSFPANTGTIQGQLLQTSGVGLQGIEVIARSVSDPTNSAVSTITGDAPVPAGSTLDKLGAFALHVPAGNYTVEFRSLREPIGQLGAITPLPGGPIFYQTSSPTAGPVNPATSATPVTVTAGQAVTINYVLGGGTVTPPQAVTQVKPDGALGQAQDLPAAATISGNIDPKDPGTYRIDLGTDPNSGLTIENRIENLYRLDLHQPSIVTVYLLPTAKVNLALYELDGSSAAFLGGAGANGVGVFVDDPADTGPRSLQILLDTGVHYLGVALWEHGIKTLTATDYTLTVSTTPIPDQPEPARPVLNQFVLGDVTSTGATARWITDTPASSVVVAGMPSQLAGDPAQGTTHQVAVTGLTAGAAADLRAISQNADGNFDSIPKVFFRTADATAATTPAQLQTSVTTAVQDFTYNAGNLDQETRIVVVTLHNSGGDATNVQLTNLSVSAASTGWKLAVPFTQPLTIGEIGSGATAVIAVRLVPTGTTIPTTIPSVTGTGTLAAAGGAAGMFNIGS